MTVTDDSLSKSPRLWCGAAALSTGTEHALDDGQAHHLRQVLRLPDGAVVRAFSAQSGEYAARLRHQGKKGASVAIEQALRAPKAADDIWLIASPLKKDALDFMVEKASELGAARFLPVLCDHTAVHRLNAERLTAQAIDAAEQCERLDVMEIAELQDLARLLAQWPAGRVLYAALERRDAMPFLLALEAAPAAPAAVLVGPEGGFSDAEKEHLLGLDFVRVVSLGDNILRAETAALAGLALWQGYQHGKFR